MKTTVKTAALGVAAMLAAGSLAACGSSDSSGSGDDSTISLGIIGPLTGAQAEIGQNYVAAAEVAAAQINADGGIDGKKIKIVQQDEGSSPDAAASALRKLGDDGVPLLVGMLSSANCLATAPTLERLKVVVVAAGCNNDSLTGEDGGKAPYANFFRVGTTDSQLVTALASAVAEKFPDVTDYDAFGYDYVTGTTEWKLYQETLKKDGVDMSVDKETFVALGEQNFKPYVQALAGTGGDKSKRALYLGTYGAGTASFLQQAQDLKLTDNYAVVVQPGGYYPVARSLDGRAPNVWNAYDYNYAAFDTDMNKKFVSDFEAKTGKKPVDWSYDAYLGVYAYKAAIEKAGSSDYSKVLDALAGVTFDSPGGELTIDPTTHRANTPIVVTNTVGDKSAPETVKVISTQVIKPEQ